MESPFVEKAVSLYTNIKDLYFPRECGFDSTFFLQFLKGSKKVRLFLIIILVIASRYVKQI